MLGAAAAPGLTPARAAVLGAVQGPTELLPVSSSAHLSLVPRLAGWDWGAIDPEARKSFEVALHAGTAAALLIGQRREIAAGLALGALAMLWADTRPQERGPGDATPADGLALGVAQAAALAPGVSRNGATLTAARARRFSREHANLLSRTVALPVIVGATLLKGSRLRRRGVAPQLGRAMAAGVATSFASTLASQRLIGVVERDRALWPYAAYRLALATLVTVKMSR